MIVEGRVERVAEAVSRLGEDVISRIEMNDPQFKAVEALVSGLRDGCEALVLIAGNALISYRLSMPGEDYWAEFSAAALEYYSTKPNPTPRGFFEEFLRLSRGNRIGVGGKLSRIHRFLSSVPRSIVCGSCSDLEHSWRMMAAALGSKPGSKTMVFAAKMLYYACRALGEEVEVPASIDIPVDTRISMLAATSGIVNHEHWRKVWRMLYRERPGLAAKAWRLVAEASGMPPLRLDAVLWLPGRAAREAGFTRDRAVRLAYSYLSRYAETSGGDLLRLCRELFHRMK